MHLCTNKRTNTCIYPSQSTPSSTFPSSAYAQNRTTPTILILFFHNGPLGLHTGLQSGVPDRRLPGSTLHLSFRPCYWFGMYPDSFLDKKRSLTYSLQLISYGIGKAIYNLYLHPLRKFPGPKLWAASATPSALSVLGGKAHEKILSLHNQYGDVVRVGPNALSFTHPEAWREVCGHLKQGQLENGKDPNYVSEEYDKSLISASRERHGPMRRTMAHGFSARAMAEQQPMINAYLDTLMTALRECGEDGKKPLNLTEWYEWTTFDIIGDLSFGEPFGCLKNRKSHPWVEILFSSLATISLIQALKDLPFFKVLAPLYFAAMMPSDFLKNKATTGKFAEETVKKRLELSVDRPDFVQAMLKKNADYVRLFPTVCCVVICLTWFLTF